MPGKGKVEVGQLGRGGGRGDGWKSEQLNEEEEKDYFVRGGR